MTFVDSKGRTMSYLERSAESAAIGATTTLVLLYGFSQHMEEMAVVTNQLDLPSNYRILVPEIFGHGTDISRVLKEGGSNYPSPTDILDALGDFLLHLNLSSPCHFMGHHLQVRNPDKIGKVIMISPSLEHVVDGRTTLRRVENRILYFRIVNHS
jgi:pimeloyl-ACP methyl ester carboxylesterase